MSGGYIKPGVPEPRVGDEVLVRGRVKQYIPGVGAELELFSKTDQYRAWARADLIEQVIPLDQTRTFKGFTVAQTRAAIRDLDSVIASHRLAAGEQPDFDGQLVLVALEGARAELVGQLDEIGASVEEEER